MIKINKGTGYVSFENKEDRKGGPVYIDGKIVGFTAGEIDDSGRLLVGRKGTESEDAMIKRHYRAIRLSGGEN